MHIDRCPHARHAPMLMADKPCKNVGHALLISLLLFRFRLSSTFAVKPGEKVLDLDVLRKWHQEIAEDCTDVLRVDLHSGCIRHYRGQLTFLCRWNVLSKSPGLKNNSLNVLDLDVCLRDEGHQTFSIFRFDQRRRLL